MFQFLKLCELAERTTAVNYTKCYIAGSLALDGQQQDVSVDLVVGDDLQTRNQNLSHHARTTLRNIIAAFACAVVS
jgi:hypothetical protein